MTLSNKSYLKQISSNYNWLKLIISALFILVYIYYTQKYHYFLPGPRPSDALQYLTPSNFGTSWGWWMWLDRLVLGIGLRIFTIFFDKVYIGRVFYISFVTVSLIIFCMIIAYKESGFLGSIFTCMFLITSDYFLRYATLIYPTQTLALFSVISFFCYKYIKQDHNLFFNGIFFSGFFSAFVAFSKITGIIFILYIIISILKDKNKNELKKYFIGLVLGTIAIFLLYIAVYNFESLLHAIYKFFKGSIKSNLTSRGNNAVSYLPVLLNVSLLPVFISLFISIGAYRNKSIKSIFSVSWAYIFIIYFIYTFSKRGGGPINLYVYTAFTFAALGLSIYLAKQLKIHISELPIIQKFKIKQNLFGILFSILLLFIVTICFNISHNNSTYFKNIYLTSNVSIFIKWLPILLPLCLVGLLSLFEYINNNKYKNYVVICLIIFSAIWCSLQNGSASTIKKQNLFYYNNAPIFNIVKQDKFSVYIKKWQTNRHASRIIWMYWALFNEKYIVENNYKSLSNTRKLVKSSIQYIKDENSIKKMKHQYVLTDSPLIIKKYFPGSNIIENINWNKKNYNIVKIKY